MGSGRPARKFIPIVQVKSDERTNEFRLESREKEMDERNRFNKDVGPDFI